MMDAYTFSQLTDAIHEHLEEIQYLQVHYDGCVINTHPGRVTLSPIEMLMIIGKDEMIDIDEIDEVVVVLKTKKELFFNYCEAC